MSLKLPFGARCTPTRPDGQTESIARTISSRNRKRFSRVPAVAVGAVVGPGLEELIDEIAVGRVDFHSVESGFHRPLGGAAVVLHDGRNFVCFEGAWRFIGQLADGGMNIVTLQLDGRRGDRKSLFLVKGCMGSPSAVPELEKDRRPLGVYRGDNNLPGLGLFVGIDPGTIQPADPLLRDHCRLGDDQSDGGPLGVVFGHQCVRHPLHACPRPCQWGHHDSVFQ